MFRIMVKPKSMMVRVTLVLFFWIRIISSAEEYYKMEDSGRGFMLENALQASEQDIPLEDFFWTGSGDGAPYIKRPMVSIDDTNMGTFIKTATVLATVYIDDSHEEETHIDPLCVFDCNDISTPTDKYSPSDRRFWLLTIIAGFFGPEDFPLLEDKLARLYRTAFLRQQARHLGIENQTHAQTSTNFNSYSYRRKKRSANFTTVRLIRKRRKIIKRNLNSKKIDNGTVSVAPIDRSFNLSSPSSVAATGRMVKKSRDSTKVDVVIHNVTYLTNDELRKIAENEVISSNSSKFENQTEIIYTVFVGGKPVLATTAADDMKYLTREEVAHVMEQIVYIKAEPFLKDPQATPLVPATINGKNYWIRLITENPILFVLTCAGLFLLVVLLMGIILLMTAKKSGKNVHHKSDINRETLMEVAHHKHEEEGGIVRGEEVDGVSNLAFENNDDARNHRKSKPVLHFPLPPGSRPSSTTSSTSDSSLYYSRNRIKIDKKGTQTVQNQNTAKDDSGYAMVVNKHEKKRDKNKIQRRKYMIENRVGSIEDTKGHTNSDSDMFDTSAQMPTLPYETNEAFNPNVQRGLSHYHKNKVLTDRNFCETLNTKPQDYDIDSIVPHGVEAINKELFKALNLQRHDRSSLDSGSIGSYLSMASVKSFPRCGVPEPLSRVLEPVSVTHLDFYDGDVDTAKSQNIDPAHLQRSSSDGADPGVIGPVVWEMHKQEVEKNSPMRDPVLTRNRFEGLLEGAIRMYNGNGNNKKVEISTVEDFGNHETPRMREFRGKSAPKLKNAGNLSRSGSSNGRPFTAGNFGTHSTHSTQPPSPTNKPAWGSGAPSPLVRPMSAGPFHRPPVPTIDVTRVLAPQDPTIDRSSITTAPLIQAIQNELKKFNRD